MATVVNMPKLGFDMAEGTLIRWVKGLGDKVSRGGGRAELETDKATVEVESLASGTLRKQLVTEGTSVPVGTPIAIIGEPNESIEGLAASPAPTAAAPVVDGPKAKETGGSKPAPSAAPVEGSLPEGVRASPLARRLAQQSALDLAGLAGTGPGGRVTRKDVLGALAASPARPASHKPGVTERIPLTKLRAAIARRMVSAKQQAPHFYLTVDLNAAGLTTMREEANAYLPESQRLSINDFILRAAALSLHDFPALNASLDGETIVRHGEVNIGSAVAVESGLLTVVVRQADTKSVQAISQELKGLVARVREGKVRPDDIEGSAFTVSNRGMFGVDEFIAILNPPEAGILAVGAVRQVPVVEGDRIVPGSRLKVTLSADHRVTDGAEAARWLQVFREYLEHPVRLIL